MTRQQSFELAIIPELDGVRGIAILMVLGFHFAHVLPRPETFLFALGWAGVDLFFALSGYLITRILLATKDNAKYFVNFYGRRVLRIFPLAFAYLAAYFWVALPLAHHFGYDLERDGSDQLWYWTYLANWHNGLHGSLSHLWSLSIEEQFYLLWPTVVFVSSSLRLKRICILLTVVPLGLRLLLMEVFHSVLAPGMTFCRTEALALGALIALLKEPRLIRTMGIVAAIGVVAISVAFGTDDRVMRIYGLTLIAFACAGLVQTTVELAGGGTYLARLLRLYWLRRFGKYSYAIYVLHAPILAVCMHLWARQPGPFSGAALFVLGIASSYAAGLTSWHLFEKKILRLKRYFDYDETRIETPEQPLLAG